MPNGKTIIIKIELNKENSLESPTSIYTVTKLKNKDIQKFVINHHNNVLFDITNIIKL